MPRDKDMTKTTSKEAVVMDEIMSSDLMSEFENKFAVHQPEEMTLTEYLDRCKTDPMCYAFAAQRMVDAIGEPVIIDTSKNPRLARLFGNKEIRTYPAFSDFFGMEDTIEAIVDFFRHAAQGLEESKQIIYLLGPVGGGKSSLVARLRDLMESRPIYVLGYRHAAQGSKPARTEWSPYFSRVLPLFAQAGMADRISKEYGIPLRYLDTKDIVGPWERKRLEESKGNLSNFRVLKLYPSRFQQIAISEAEPGDENTQDISTLVGKVDMRKLEDFSQDDPDAYLYSGALNLTNQGLMEFKEMFKAKIKMLNPLLFAVQEHNYQGTENIGALPFNGIICAHSNEGEWLKFKNNRENEAFLDRICIVKVPYCLRIDEEMEIYKKAISESELAGKSIAPGTLEILAMFSCISRIKEPQNSDWYSKLKVYNGENLREKDVRAKDYREYREDSENRDEGFFPAISTRWAFKRLSQCFNADPHEIAADPIHMMRVLLTEIEKDFTPEQEATFKKVIKDLIKEKYYFPMVDREIRAAYLESYSDYGQNLFDRYFMWAEKWVNSEDYFDPGTGLTMNKEALDNELSKIEKPADISNPKDFRNEIVNWILRYQAKNNGANPSWRSYEKLKGVIEKTMFTKTEDLLPVISFAKKPTEDAEKKHNEFVQRMKDRGYTERQIRRIVDWYMRVQKAN
jgi:serine protein kinase